MKKTVLSILFATGLLASGAAAAATDWSPVFCQVLDQCGKNGIAWDGWDDKKLPASYRNAIAKKTGKTLHGGDSVQYDYLLKDSTAFGFPLKKVGINNSGGSSGITLYFADSRFMSLKPKIARLQAKEKQNPSECGETIWKINSQNNSLSIDYGC